MENNDILPWETAKQGTIFEGVLATPPSRSLLKDLLNKGNDWDTKILRWKAGDLCLRSIIDCVNRLGIRTDVYTFLDPDAPEPIERWLTRKGVSVSCFYYPSVEELAEDLRYNRAIHKVYVPTKEMWLTIGPRATVVSPDTAWVV